MEVNKYSYKDIRSPDPCFTATYQLLDDFTFQSTEYSVPPRQMAMIGPTIFTGNWFLRVDSLKPEYIDQCPTCRDENNLSNGSCSACGKDIPRKELYKRVSPKSPPFTSPRTLVHLLDE